MKVDCTKSAIPANQEVLITDWLETLATGAPEVESCP